MLNWQEFVILTIEYGATVQEETAVKVKLREQIQQLQMVSSMEQRWNGTNLNGLKILQRNKFR